MNQPMVYVILSAITITDSLIFGKQITILTPWFQVSADPGGRAVLVAGLCPFACWDREF
jgi:hypothetical protein